MAGYRLYCVNYNLKPTMWSFPLRRDAPRYISMLWRWLPELVAQPAECPLLRGIRSHQPCTLCYGCPHLCQCKYIFPRRRLRGPRRPSWRHPSVPERSHRRTRNCNFQFPVWRNNRLGSFGKACQLREGVRELINSGVIFQDFKMSDGYLIHVMYLLVLAIITLWLW